MSMQNRLLARSLYHKIQGAGTSTCSTTSTCAYYSTTSTLLKSNSALSKDERRQIAQNYNNHRAAYKRAVGKLRKQYADEVAEQRRADAKAAAEEQARLTRQRLERQRLKNIRSVKNAVIMEEVRLKRKKEFEEELRIAQVNREARAERFDKARRMVVQELNEESVHWLSTPEEVDAAFDGTANEQKLWSRMGGYIGAPMPTEDAEFWRFESHTWTPSRRYKTHREKFLEELLETSYNNSNLKESYWTDELAMFQGELEEKAKLRALVRLEGRRSLLMKQQDYLRDINIRNQVTQPNGLPAPPKKQPVPSLKILADYEAMEQEGIKLLEEDPTKFFVFEDSDTADGEGEGEDGDENAGGETTKKKAVGKTGTMGKPLRLRDPVRDNTPTGTPYPEILGRVLKKKHRTQKEIKRQEREEKMWAAAAAEATDVDNNEEEVVPETNDPTDYQKILNYGDDYDLAWEEGLDPVKDADLLNTPRRLRFDEDDAEWFQEKLSKKITSLEELAMREELSELQRLGIDGKVEASAKVDEDELDLDYHDLSESYDTSVFDTLNEDQIVAMMALSEEDSKPKTAEEIKISLSKVPGLTDEQIESIVELEMSLLQEVGESD